MNDSATAGMVRDPVCGMVAREGEWHYEHVHEGTTYHFCAETCRSKFAANPKRYLEPDQVPPPPAPPGTRYICPMDPEVLEDKPGPCPICGMALEASVPTLSEGPDPERLDMTRRLWIGGLLAAPVVLLEMGPHVGITWPGISPRLGQWLQLVFATPVVLYAGWPFLERGARSLRTRQFNMFTLIAIGTLVALAYSLVATVAPGLFPAAIRGHHGLVPVYFEAAAVIIVLVLVGQVLELGARERTGEAIRALLRLAPKTATLVTADGRDETVEIASVITGNRLRIRPGETVPVDGRIVEGASTLDQSMLTGESLPIQRGVGDAVIGGTLNQQGSFVMQAEKVGRDTVLARIVGLVAEAQRSRAPAQRLADQVSTWFVPLVLAIAVLAFLIWLLVGPEPRLGFALVAAVSVLIIACPCALGLATPMSIMVGIGRGARSGILIKDAAALERLAEVDTVVLDKTGTLTAGHPSVTRIVVAPGVARDEAGLLKLAASVERSSQHPIGQAIVKEARQRKISLTPARDFEAPAGKGVRAIVGRETVLAGNSAFLAEHGASTAALDTEAEAIRKDGGTVVFLAADGVSLGFVAVADTVKPNSKAAVAALRDTGVRVIMLTGDTRTTAEAIARDLGIDEVEAGALPDTKRALVDRLKADMRVVAMVGDGVNDAPALAAADVGVAMGTGTDAAIGSAGLTLVSGDLAKLTEARRLAQATRANIRQNLTFAFLYNALGVPVAAGLLYPLFGWLLSPMIAAAAMSLSSVSVIANALRLARIKL